MHLNDIIDIIINSNDYASYIITLDNKINRSAVLNVHLNDTDVYNFYSSLTYDELTIIGY